MTSYIYPSATQTSCWNVLYNNIVSNHVTQNFYTTPLIASVGSDSLLCSNFAELIWWRYRRKVQRSESCNIYANSIICCTKNLQVLGQGRVHKAEARLLLPAATAANSETLCYVLATSCQSDQPKQCEVCPRAWPLRLESMPLIVFWKSSQKWFSDDQQGLELGLKVLNSAAQLTTSKHYLLRNPWIDVWSSNSFRSVEFLKLPELRQAK